MLLFKKTAFDVAVSLVVYQKEIKTLKHSKSVYLSRKLLLPAVMSPPIPEPDVTPPLFDSFSSTPSQEASLEDSTVEQDLPSEQPIETTYHLVLKGTIRGNTKLVTNTGYTFNIRKRGPNGTIDWQCTVRRKDHRCKASVIQRDGAFLAGMHDHNHPGEFGVLASIQIQSRVKQVQLIYFFKLLV